jgi:uncharacterized caspase-like protein
MTRERLGQPDLAAADYRAALAMPPKYDDGVEAHKTARERLAALPAAPTVKRPPPALAPVQTTELGRRVALVIGNGSYRNAPLLDNPRRDAQAVAAAFRRLGFAEVVERYDLALRELSVELKRFGDVSAGADWAVVYFAGHGIEVGGANYLVPVDARLERSAHVEEEAYPLERVLSKVEPARQLRLVILDACRNNPFVPKMQTSGTTRAIGRGLSRVDPTGGVLVAYSARAGSLADDGDGPNSPFATAFLEHLEQRLELRLFFGKVRDTVLARTRNEQEPFTYGSLPGVEFHFKP